MNQKPRSLLRVATAGAACGFAFLIAMFYVCPQSSDEPSLLRDFFVWLTSPVTDLMIGLGDEYLTVFVILVSIYFVILGAIAGVAIYCLVVLARKFWRIQKAWGQPHE